MKDFVSKHCLRWSETHQLSHLRLLSLLYHSPMLYNAALLILIAVCEVHICREVCDWKVDYCYIKDRIIIAYKYIICMKRKIIWQLTVYNVATVP